VGLIIGSMGLSGAIIQRTVSRLQALVSAAGKKSYVLVMGRLNEAKLCNFPEIDLYCLVSNDDTSLISPKTFHIPVITPYELELGLGAREWSSNYVVGGFVGEASGGEGAGTEGTEGAAAEEEFARMLERVRLNRPEDAIDISSDEEEWTEGDGAGSSGAGAGAGGDSATPAASSALTTTNSERRLANQFVSAGADFLKTREFQGLSYGLSPGQQTALDAVQGQSGIASGYTYEAAAAGEGTGVGTEMLPPVPVTTTAADVATTTTTTEK
jgi:diphthamide biosynthesis protein 2